MGYYTSFKITQEKNPTDFEKIRKKLEEISGGYTFDEDGNSEDNYKWYDSEKDMCAISKLHPKTIFKVHGEGEEAGDIWDMYYQGGKKIHEERLKAELPVPDFLAPKAKKQVKKAVDEPKGRRFRIDA